jgi:hypothetical protein
MLANTKAFSGTVKHDLLALVTDALRIDSDYQSYSGWSSRRTCS